MNKLCRRLVIFLVCALCLSGVASGAPSSPHTISVILDLSGPGTFLGKAEQTSLVALEDVVNKQGGIKGMPIRFEFFDDQTSPQLAVQLLNQVLPQKPALFLGSSLTATCTAMAPLLEHGPVDYCLSNASHPSVGSFVFSAGVSTRDEFKVFLKYFRQRHWSRMARLSTTDASGQDADDAFTALLKLPENKDMLQVASEHFNQGDLSVAAQVAKIKAATPQVIVIVAPGTAFGNALHALSDAGLDDIPVAASASNLTIAQMKQYGALQPANLYFGSVGYFGGVPQNRSQAAAFRIYFDAMKAHNLYIDTGTGIGWDPGMIVIDALRALGPDATPDRVHDWIEHLHGYAGISGIYDFRDGGQRGLTEKAVVMLRWDNTQFRWVAVSKPGGDPM